VSGYVRTSGDCDDDDASANPGEIEWCDSIDNDCNALVDDAVVTVDWYADTDGDGYGDPADVTSDCLQPTGYIATAGDCDDTTADISPDAADSCGSGVDEDCDGAVDNAASILSADLLLAGTTTGEMGAASRRAISMPMGSRILMGAPASPGGRIWIRRCACRSR
jgi:hypothetical protein